MSASHEEVIEELEANGLSLGPIAKPIFDCRNEITNNHVGGDLTVKTVLRLDKQSILSPIPNMLPEESPCSIGREDAAQTLNTAFKKEGLVRIGIQGQAGCGKSELAIQYAHQNQRTSRPYQLIRWLKADSEESLKNAYFSLGDALGIVRKDYEGIEENLKNAINCRLLLYGRVLLIYDNIEDMSYVARYQPSMGANTTIHFIFTTRNCLIDLPMVEVKEFSLQETQIYLSKRLQKEVSLELVAQLGQELGYLPLAIVQSFGYMKQYSKSIESFLPLLKTAKRQRILAISDPNLKAVATLWQVSIERLSILALKVMRLCAHLDPDNIPRLLLEKFIGESDSDDILMELRSQSLLVEAGNRKESFRIHRLLQEAIRRQLLQKDNSGILAREIVEKCIESLPIVIGDTKEMPNSGLYSFSEKDFCELT